MPKKPRAGVGAVENANTAVLVTLTREALLDRRLVSLTPPGLPTHPYHHEGAWAVGRYLGTPGARRVSLAEAFALIEAVRAAALVGARAALEAVAATVEVPIGALSLRRCPELPPTVEGCLRDARAQTQADSVMYRRALATAAEERGWQVRWYEPAQALRDAATILGVTSRSVEALIRGFGRAAGPPWQARHALAAAAALAGQGRPTR